MLMIRPCGTVERIFAEWLYTSLHELAMDPARVANKHDDVTRENGPYIANGSMRTLRAIYYHARKTNKSLPTDNPADAVDGDDEEYLCPRCAERRRAAADQPV